MINADDLRVDLRNKCIELFKSLKFQYTTAGDVVFPGADKSPLGQLLDDNPEVTELDLSFR